MSNKKSKGRPPLPEGEGRTELVSFRLTERERQVLQDYCWRYDISESEVIRDALRILGVIPDWRR